MKRRNVPIERRREFGVGDVWTFVAIDAETKLIPTWRLGWRDDNTTSEFINDLAERLSGRIQLTSDGLGTYPTAVEVAFNHDGVDYAQLVKIYEEQPKEERRRYSPSRFISATISKVFGDPDEDHVSTSYIERQNLNIRMFNRRMTRLANAFSRKVENHAHQLAINFAHHNFCRIPRTTRATPAMLVGITSSPWDVADLVKMTDEYWTNQAWKLAKAS
jgi:IS1 family transposase